MNPPNENWPDSESRSVCTTFFIVLCVLTSTGSRLSFLGRDDSVVGETSYETVIPGELDNGDIEITLSNNHYSN